jgi:hypothetical protein
MDLVLAGVRECGEGRLALIPASKLFLIPNSFIIIIVVKIISYQTL